MNLKFLNLFFPNIFGRVFNFVDSANMSVYRICPREVFVTNFAKEGSFSSVDSHVLWQVGFISEYTTEGTLISVEFSLAIRNI